MRLLKNIAVMVLLTPFLIMSFSLILRSIPNIQEDLQLFKDQLSVNISSYIPDPSLNQGNASAAISKVSPAVVSIFGTKDIQSLAPFHIATMTEVKAGTGFFVDPNGYIITNKHVVADPDSSYSVILQNGKKRAAKVVYLDPSNDIAMIKIDGSNYPVLSLGDSERLKIGQEVIGIGNAYGKFADTVSSGNVQGLNRTIFASDEETDQELHHIIETSAQLYPGDSGGPLFDLQGNVVGVNVAIAASVSNESFSIPIDDVKTVIKEVVQNPLSYK